ncbi:LacI family DNA-binding transcriptional regulator [Marinobacterium rhizophilum]|uniref:LacI family DNA-binding transcriptional regulator n=1 Tax=Marinobacterium rhizophilum TaxID=420402 RepID=A0ABY5HFS4_9GAMM|nr:LacI family DNA-binding transcriptional regulator [Marinobacterium rhizophilum]UTW11203.1 LacI family DNA-binding transcriptional regulator [Marinobacterium rhizophilum]
MSSSSQTADKLSRPVNITITEVAAEAEVSISAVSRAFNPNGSCSAKTRAKVFAAAEKLGYKPNRLARGLKSSSSLIGILMTDFENPAYLSILSDLTATIQEHNCHSLLINVGPQKSVTEAVELIMEYHVDGLIVTSSSLPDELVSACQRRNTPVVIFGHHSRNAPATIVSCDNVAGGRMAADALLDAGYTRPAFVGATTSAPITTDRQRGFITRLIERGCTEWTTTEGNQHSYDSGYEATCKLFTSHAKPDSVFYLDDIMACGGMDAIRYEFGLKVPEDIGIIGVDDIRLAASRAYDLTTIRQPFTDMVNTAVTALFEHIQDASMAPQNIILPCTLITRGSTRASIAGAQTA